MLNKGTSFTLLLSVILLAYSCKKDETEEVPLSTFSYELDGVPVTLSSKTELTFSFGGMIIQTVGEETPSKILYIKSPLLDITVKDHEDVIQPGIYSGKTYYNSGYTKEVSFSYQHSSDTLYQSSFTNPITSVTITKISRSGVFGTFSGEVLKPGSFDTVQITNGSFAIYTYQ